jgi:hypothetical protein
MKEIVIGIVSAVPILFGAAEALIEGRYLTLAVTFAVLSGVCFVAAILRVRA